jgi:hypothetical protein
MAASSSSSSATATVDVDPTLLPHYVVVVKDAWRGCFMVTVEQTVRTFKDTVAAFMNAHATLPAIDLQDETTKLFRTVTADSFQLRPGTAKDIILKDTQLIHDVVKFNFITPTVYLVMLDDDGNATPINELPVAEPIIYEKEFMKDIRDKIRVEIDEKYSVVPQ